MYRYGYGHHINSHTNGKKKKKKFYINMAMLECLTKQLVVCTYIHIPATQPTLLFTTSWNNILVEKRATILVYCINVESVGIMEEGSTHWDSLTGNQKIMQYRWEKMNRKEIKRREGVYKLTQEFMEFVCLWI